MQLNQIPNQIKSMPVGVMVHQLSCISEDQRHEGSNIAESLCTSAAKSQKEKQPALMQAVTSPSMLEHCFAWSGLHEVSSLQASKKGAGGEAAKNITQHVESGG